MGMKTPCGYNESPRQGESIYIPDAVQTYLVLHMNKPPFKTRE